MAIKVLANLFSWGTLFIAEFDPHFDSEIVFKVRFAFVEKTCAAN
jgi:hypothetical protein